VNESNTIVVNEVVGLWVRVWVRRSVRTWSCVDDSVSRSCRTGELTRCRTRVCAAADWVSTGVVGEWADVLPFTCVAVELRTVRRSELVGRTSLSYRRREWLCLVAASSCRTSRCRSDVVACRWSCRPCLSPRRHPFDAVGWATIASWPRFPDPVPRTVIAVGVRSWFDGVPEQVPRLLSHVFHIFSLLTVSLLFLGSFVAWRDECQLNLLWTSWSFTKLLKLKNFSRLWCAN